jgi:hypothetical protein
MSISSINLVLGSAPFARLEGRRRRSSFETPCFARLLKSARLDSTLRSVEAIRWTRGNLADTEEHA